MSKFQNFQTLISAPEAQDLKVLEWNPFTVFGAPETQRSQRLFRISKSELEKLKDVKLLE
jgi:hypothetical protein